METELSHKHEEFVIEFLKCKNATKAYLKVYPDSSYAAASVSSSELLRNPNIVQRIKDITDPIRKVLPEIIRSHLYELATFDVSEFIDEEGNIDILKIKEKSIPGIISGIHVREDRRDGEKNSSFSKSTSIKFTNQEKVIELLAKVENLIKENQFNDNSVTNIIFAPYDPNIDGQKTDDTETNSLPTESQ